MIIDGVWIHRVGAGFAREALLPGGGIYKGYPVGFAPRTTVWLQKATVRQAIQHCRNSALEEWNSMDRPGSTSADREDCMFIVCL